MFFGEKKRKKKLRRYKNFFILLIIGVDFVEEPYIELSEKFFEFRRLHACRVVQAFTLEFPFFTATPVPGELVLQPFAVIV